MLKKSPSADSLIQRRSSDDLSHRASKEDVLAAFQTLASAGPITEEVIRAQFVADPATADFLVDQLNDGDFQAFTDDLFSR